MDYLKNTLAELYESEYSGIDEVIGKTIDVAGAVGKTLQKKLEILREAIEELNQDIQERERISQQVQDKIGGDVFDLEFELRELKHWAPGVNDSIEARRLGLERELLDLKQQERSEYIRKWSDISGLKRKRREFITEYQHLLKTMEVLDGE
ncbi:MAG: hypothetical protein JRI96_04355 [Deltaproteobacteria bacterium]|nr:hypothetical protein [Deltaproteobacteria bacterium]